MGALDIPSKYEILNAITSMMTQAKKVQIVSLGNRYGRKSTFSEILEYILCRYINQERNGTYVRPLKPVQAIRHSMDVY